MTTDKQELQRLCDETLPRVAQEIRDQDIAGWGNACDWAADALRELLAENAALKARVKELEAIEPKWMPISDGLRKRLNRDRALCVTTFTPVVEGRRDYCRLERAYQIGYGVQSMGFRTADAVLLIEQPPEAPHD